jgi:hypothetical protein
MLLLFYKFIRETITLLNYIFSYYVSNIIIITSLQILFVLAIFKLYQILKILIKEYQKKIFASQKINLIKNIFLSYHKEQMKFINKIFESELVMELLNEKSIINYNNKNIIIDSELINNNFYDNNSLKKNYENLPKLPDSPINKN